MLFSLSRCPISLALLAAFGLLGTSRPTTSASQAHAGPGLHKRLSLDASTSISASSGSLNVEVSLALPRLNAKSKSSQMMGQYWPNWQTKQTPAEVSWGHADLAWYFVLPTAADGYSMDGASASGMKDFVAAAHGEGKTALVSPGPHVHSTCVREQAS